MIDADGYRPNVGMIICNEHNQVLWAKRRGENAWQFPQGGIDRAETPEQAMFRELEEEVGTANVCIIGRTQGWLRYEVPCSRHRAQRRRYRGQKQIWFLLRLVGRDNDISLRASDHPEFDAWRWNHYWVPLDCVIEFKRQVYELALNELARYLDADQRRGRRQALREQPGRGNDEEAPLGGDC